MSGGAALLAVLSVIGYVLLKHCCHRTSFRWDALEWQQNIFESTSLGLALFGACRLLSPVVEWAQTRVGLRLEVVGSFLDARLAFPFVGSIVASFLLGLVLAGLANLRWPRDRAHALATVHHGGSLRALLLDAHLSQRAVMLTLASRKVYVGWVFVPPPLRKLAHVVLFPTLSGYRSTDNLAITWTTDYSPAYLDLMARSQKGEALRTEPGHFQLVIPLESVTSATYFDKELYDRHFALPGVETEPPGALGSREAEPAKAVDKQ